MIVPCTLLAQALVNTTEQEELPDDVVDDWLAVEEDAVLDSVVVGTVVVEAVVVDTVVVDCTMVEDEDVVDCSVVEDEEVVDSSPVQTFCPLRVIPVMEGLTSPAKVMAYSNSKVSPALTPLCTNQSGLVTVKEVPVFGSTFA